ncbi:MAG: hypothetical protein V1929_09390 [bacterium]
MRTTSLVIGISVLAVSSAALAGKLENRNFEKEFEVINDVTHWGSEGEVFGSCRAVKAGDEGQPAKAADGERCVVIDVPTNSWSGLWQQTTTSPKRPYVWKARHLIQGGSLPDTVATFMKVEFFDDKDQFLSAAEGEWLRLDTKGQWIEKTMKGTTPDRTKKIRFVITAGDNAESAEVVNRIYWDSTSAQ